jgi:ATP-dependent exoDNAse (exonuclease V) alpha subunit
MLDKAPLELSADFQYALDAIEKERRNLFITGRAGTGKSTLLQLFRSTTRRKTVVLAPTGIAALNVGGQTIHSFFGFPPRFLQRSEINKRRDRRIYNNLEILIIDEISMVRADMLDNIDYFLRLNRENPKPFGGVQVVFFGDLFQLPPVLNNQSGELQLFHSFYQCPYFFAARVLEDFELDRIELQKVYRQENRHFLKLLEGVRLNRIELDELMELNARYDRDFVPQDFYITLTARNDRANAINQHELDRIPLPAQTYIATVTGEFNPQLFPTEQALRLKLNAQVMFVKNDPKRQFVNGTIGKVVKLERDTITVMIEENDTRRYVEVEPLDWEILRYEPSPTDPTDIQSRVIGTFRQFPLRLAWAVTIHKAQGKTFDKVIIDLGSGAFEHGQTYVALSRCRTLEGIVLKQPIRQKDILTDERIVEFYERFF